MSLVVYKSSAGSGKTTTLVNEYLSLALRNPERFGSIIALTFTIKATTEMKERVFTVLDKIINLDKNRNDPGLTSGIAHIEKATGLNEIEIQRRSKILLQNILHQYTDFSFSTIDSFVVKIVRSFAHDLNLAFDFNIELDSNLLIEQAIAMLFEKIGTDKELTNFLIQYILNSVDKESSLKIENELAKLGKILFESRHYESIEKLRDLKLDQFSEINKKLKSDFAKIEKSIFETANNTLDLIAKNGIEHKDFYRSLFPNQLKKYTKEVNSKIPNTLILNQDSNFYANSKSEDIKDAIDSIKPQLIAQSEKIVALIESYNNIKLILEMLNPLALLTEIKHLLDQYSEENNVIHLSESNKMIADIVLKEHIPFVYERVGRKYLHFLVDEFQDTSVIQWNNLIPLIDNSLATDNFNMIVGDAKQSIYRWRDGDVDQFINLPHIANGSSSEIMQERAQSIKRNYSEKTLQHNYRSELNIIEFNNAFFDFQLEHSFGKKGSTYTNKDSERISKIYKNHQQIPGKQADNGKVILQNYPKDGEQTYEEGLLAHIDILLKQNYELKDIAIIARAKTILAQASDILVRNGYKVVSNETLYIEKNPQVALLVSFISYIGNSDRKNNLLNILHLLSKEYNTQDNNHLKHIENYLNAIGYNRDIDILCESVSKFGYTLNAATLTEMQTYDLAEYLIIQLGINNNPNPFVQSLLNNILENSQKNGSGLSAFLNFWELKKDKISISLPENIDAIQLYTIHKAKGLEFPVVIFPANGFANKGGGLHWVEPKKAAIEGLTIAMVKHKAELNNSSFSEEYADEEDKKKMDDLNLIYVTNTRPTEQLIILFEEKSGSLWDKFKDFRIDNPKFQSIDENQLVYGSIENKTKKPTTGKENQINKIISAAWTNRIHLKQSTSINIDEEQQQRIDKGNTIHLLLSLYNSSNKISSVVNTALLQGIISKGESDYYNNLLKSIIEHPKVKVFFQEGDVEINECSILLPDGKQLRPDKVILRKNETIIIDYKVSNYDTISEFEKDKHLKQVKKYQNLLEEMHYKNVNPHLIYIDSSIKVINV